MLNEEIFGTAASIQTFTQSGLGREGAQEGMIEFLETQYISVSW
jgi:succinate-semialdehyde dehydrogenase/glutarate-semialdehyde dehydrogenase